MVNGKIIVTLVAIVAALIALFNLNFNSVTQENYFGNLPKMRQKAVMVGQTANGSEFALPAGSSQMANIAYPNVLAKGDMYQIPGLWQSSLSPRAGLPQGSVKSFVRWNPPALEHQAAEGFNPLMVSRMVEGYSHPGHITEGYCKGCNQGGCSVGGVTGMKVRPPQPTAPDYTAGNYKSVEKTLSQDPTISQLPVTGMESVAADGLDQAPIVYTRFIYSNAKSNLFGLGDYIRGDLAIAPCTNEWFRPSVTPQNDLNPGALAVMGGLDNGTAQQTYKMINNASGGTYDTLAGVNLAVQKDSDLSAFQHDVTVNAFP